MTEKKNVLTYKGRPLVREKDQIYYGSMADKYIVEMRILETKQVKGVEIGSRVLVQLMLTDPDLKARDRVVKKSEKDGFYAALDVGSVWLERNLSSK